MTAADFLNAVPIFVLVAYPIAFLIRAIRKRLP